MKADHDESKEMEYEDLNNDSSAGMVENSHSRHEDEDNGVEYRNADSGPVQYDAVTTTYEPQKPLRRTMSEATFHCGCCYELMVQPTTLNCGHSFCRLCLARWWQSSKDTTCPGCRQPWRGFPHINIIMRTTLEKLFPVPITMRRGLLNDPENRRLLSDFEKFGKDLQEQGKKKSRSGFCSGVVFSLVVVLLLVLVWGLRDDTNSLVKKPVSKWTSQEVADWVSGLGTWSREHSLPEKFLENKVDGRLLLGLTEDDLRNAPFGITINLYIRAIMHELKTVKDLGVKPPRDLWEYKTMHEGKSIFLSYSLKDFPRIAMAYFYVFDYEDLFLPFFHITTCPPPTNHSLADDGPVLSEPTDPTVEQWIEFLPKYLFFPYFLIAQFAFNWFDNHGWTCSFVIANCVLLTFIEATMIRWVWKNGIRSVPVAVRRHVLAMVGTAILVLLWPIIPFFICDGMFYWALYLSPFMNMEKLFKILKGRY